MIVIYCLAGLDLSRCETAPIPTPTWEFMEAPQDIEQAWKLADELTALTGFDHFAGRV